MQRFTPQEKTDYAQLLKDLKKAQILASEIEEIVSRPKSFWYRLKIFLLALMGRYP